MGEKEEIAFKKKRTRKDTSKIDGQIQSGNVAIDNIQKPPDKARKKTAAAPAVKKKKTQRDKKTKKKEVTEMKKRRRAV